MRTDSYSAATGAIYAIFICELIFKKKREGRKEYLQEDVYTQRTEEKRKGKQRMK